MRRFFGSIRFRMVAIYLAVILLAFVAVSALISSMVGKFLINQRTQAQLKKTEDFALVLPAILNGNDVPVNLYNAATVWANENAGRLLYLDPDAVTQMDTASMYNGYRLPFNEVYRVRANNMSSSYGFHKITTISEFSDTLTFSQASTWVVYYAVPVQDETGMLMGILLFSTSIQDILDSSGDVTQQIGVVFAVFAIMVGLISLFVSGWLTRPILTLTNAIRRVGVQGYSERVPVRGKDELAALSEAFNIMSEKLENHDRLRNEFVSNASHELKTPLSAMKILAESMLYQENPDPETTREFFTDIDHEIDRLTYIINDLLKLVQEESKAHQLDITSFDYGALIQRVIRRLQPIAKQKGIRIERKLTDIIIEADQARIEQVVSNLIDNAIKYTEKGSISIALKLEGNEVLFSVQDTGIGIPKESISRLFERFYRVDKARSRYTGGTGLGLSIVERIISMHGGYIHVESIENKGSTFIVRLPLFQGQYEEGD